MEELPSALPSDILNTVRKKARSGSQQALAYVAKMEKRDVESFTSKEKYLLKKHIYTFEGMR